MTDERVVDLAPVGLPRTYREKYWGEIGAAVLVAIMLWARTIGSDPYVIYPVLGLSLFMVLNIIATRIVLHDDRIESVNLLGRRVLFKSHIDRLEIRESKVKGKTVTTYLLIPRTGLDKALMIPSALAMDEVWFNWMAPIPETRMDAMPVKPAGGKGAATALVLLLVLGLTGMMILPKVRPDFKPYLDVSNLFLPWLICLYMLSNSRLLSDRTTYLDGTGSTRMAIGLMFIIISPTYLIVGGHRLNVFVVGPDSLLLVYACFAMALASLVLLRFSGIDMLNMKREALVVVVGFAGLYGYGAALTANELFDSSAGQAARVKIEGKYVRTGKGGGSFFKLSPWGPETMERSYRPSPGAYNQLQVSDSICAYLHPGAIGMRWYQLTDFCPE